MAGPKCDDCPSDIFKSTATLGAGACTVGCKSIAPRGALVQKLEEGQKVSAVVGTSPTSS
jgi:hypothetical protein